MNSSSISDKHHRIPPQIIAHVVWLYVRFNLSLREVEEMMLDREVDVSYETHGAGSSSSAPGLPTFCGGGSRAPAMYGT